MRNSSPPWRATRSPERTAPQPVGDLAQELVAGGVPEAVVHELEVVEVDEEHGGARAGPAGPGQDELQVLVEHRPVREAGQRIVVGQVGEPILGALALGDVEQEPLPEERRAVGSADRHGAVEQPHGPAVAGDQTVLLLEHRPLVAALRRERADPLAIVLVQDGREEGAAVLHPVVGRVAQHQLDVRADVRHPALERVHIRADGHVLDELAVAPLGRPQLLLGALALGDVARQARVEERVCDRARDHVGQGAEELDLVGGELVPFVVADPHHADRVAAGDERGHERRTGIGLDHLGLVRLEDAPRDVGVGLDRRRAAAEGDERAGLAVVSLERHGMRACERGRAQSDLAEDVVEIETGSELSRQVEERVQPARGSHGGFIGSGFSRLEHYRTRLRSSPSLGAGWTRSPRRARSRLQSQQKGSNPRKRRRRQDGLRARCRRPQRRVRPSERKHTLAVSDPRGGAMLTWDDIRAIDAITDPFGSRIDLRRPPR